MSNSTLLTTHKNHTIIMKILEIKPVFEIVEKVDIDYKLRWIGFKSGDEVATAKFIDKKERVWECSFQSSGEQSLFYDRKDISKKLKDIKELELVKNLITQFLSEEELKDKEKITDFICSIIDEAKNESLEEEHIPLMEYLDNKDYFSWSSNSWIEEYFQVINKNGEVLFKDYISNHCSERVYDSYSELKKDYLNENYLQEIVEAFEYTLISKKVKF